MKWVKVKRGFYRLTGTRYAVQADGYEASQSISADAHYEGFIGGEWACIRYPNEADAIADERGDNLDWFPTMREAKAMAERSVLDARVRDALDNVVVQRWLPADIHPASSLYDLTVRELRDEYLARRELMT